MKIVKFTREDFRHFTDDETFERIVDVTNIVDFLNMIHNYGDTPAIGKTDGQVATFNELYTDVLKVCSVLNKKGVVRSTNVGLVCGNNYTFAVAALGIMAYGCVATLLPAHLDDKTLFGCAQKYDLTAIVYDDVLQEKMGLIQSAKGVINFAASEIFAEKRVDGNLLCNNLQPDDSACIIMTGGTTGRSKGAVLSHTALMCGTINGCYAMKTLFGRTYYCLIPLTHVFGFIRNLLTSLYTGSLIYFNTDKRLMFEELQKYKPDSLVIVPALAELFLNLAKAYGLGFLGGRLNLIICGAANIAPYLITEFFKLGVLFGAGYGLTEFSNMVSGNVIGDRKPESVGMLYPEQEAKIVNGELWLRGRNQMKYYYAEPEENARAFEDGWFKTGDLARFDEDNYLYIIGRLKDVIVLPNGENVSPAYIEAKINELNYIQDSLVYESKNSFGATILKVEVVLRQSVVKALGIEQDKLYDYVKAGIDKVNATLLDYERVSELVIRDKDFDRSPSMKIIRPRKMY